MFFQQFQIAQTKAQSPTRIQAFTFLLITFFEQVFFSTGLSITFLQLTNILVILGGGDVLNVK